MNSSALGTDVGIGALGLCSVLTGRRGPQSLQVNRRAARLGRDCDGALPGADGKAPRETSKPGYREEGARKRTFKSLTWQACFPQMAAAAPVR